MSLNWCPFFRKIFFLFSILKLLIVTERQREVRVQVQQAQCVHDLCVVSKMLVLNSEMVVFVKCLIIALGANSCKYAFLFFLFFLKSQNMLLSVCVEGVGSLLAALLPPLFFFLK